MAHEIDGNGNILIHAFTVTYTDTEHAVCETETRHFSDYTQGWSWARQAGCDWQGIDTHNTYNVDIQSDWISEKQWDKGYED